jgi:hypothetical protein
MLAASIHAARWDALGATAGSRAVALAWLAARRVREAICGLRRHDMVLHFEPDRLCLQCLACGARTQGWTLDVNPAYRRPRRQVGTQTWRRLDKTSQQMCRRYESESRGEQLPAA